MAEDVVIYEYTETHTNLKSANPVLGPGQVVYVKDVYILAYKCENIVRKIGDGVTPFNSLPWLDTIEIKQSVTLADANFTISGTRVRAINNYASSELNLRYIGGVKFLALQPGETATVQYDQIDDVWRVVEGSLIRTTSSDIVNKVATQKTLTIPKYITDGYTNLVQDPTDLTAASWFRPNSAVSVEDSGITIDGVKLWKLSAIGSDPAARVESSCGILTGSYHVFSVIIRKGNVDQTLIDTIATEADNEITITFSTKNITAASGGTLLKAEWFDDVTLKLYIKAPTGTGDTKLRLFVHKYSATVDDFTYFSQPQLVDNTTTVYPFVNGTKEADTISTEFAMPNKFTFDMIFEPLFSYDTLIYHRLFSWYINDSNRMRLLWNPANDFFVVHFEENDDQMLLEGQRYDDGTSYVNLNQKIRLVGSIDLTTGTLYGSRFIELTDTDPKNEKITWSGVPSVKSENFTTLQIGNHASGNQALSEFEYLRIYEGLLVGDVNSSSDVDELLMNQTLLFDASIDEFKETNIPAGTSTATAIEMLAEDVKTGVAIQDGAIIERHVKDLAFTEGLSLSPERKAFQELESETLTTAGWYTILEGAANTSASINASVVVMSDGNKSLGCELAFVPSTTSKTTLNTTLRLFGNAFDFGSSNSNILGYRLAKSDTVNTSGWKLQVNLSAGLTPTIQLNRNLGRANTQLGIGGTLVPPYLDNTPTLPDEVTPATFIEAGAKIVFAGGTLTTFASGVEIIRWNANQVRFNVLAENILKQGSGVVINGTDNRIYNYNGTVPYTIDGSETLSDIQIRGKRLSFVLTKIGAFTSHTALSRLPLYSYNGSITITG